MADSAEKENFNFHIHPDDLPHLEVHSVNGPGLAGDVSVTGSSVSKKHVSKLLPTLSNNNNPEGVKN